MLAPCVGQVDIADPGESGFGVGAGLGASDGIYSYAANASYTAAGSVEFGATYGRQGGNGPDFSVMGAYLAFLPLHLTDGSARLSLGGQVGFERYGNSRYNFSSTVKTFAGLVTLDAASSEKTDFQFSAAIARTLYENSSSITTVAGAVTIVAKKSKGNSFITLSISKPTEKNTDPMFGIQFGMFYKSNNSAKDN